MRRCLACFITLVVVNLTNLHASETEIRPALIGNGPKALVNVINVNRLIKKGQSDGLLMFTCYVSPNGHVLNFSIYRDTPGSKVLKEEIKSALPACRFVPAIYNGKHTDASFAGTVVFTISDAKPHLRVYANQNPEDIKNGNDFVAPQLRPDTFTWTGISHDLGLLKAQAYHQQAAMQFSITVDTSGNVKAVEVVSEDPPGFGLGEAFRKIYTGAKWIPGFRNGQPVECTFAYTDYFRD